VANRYHPDPNILLTSFVLGTKDGKPVTLLKNGNDILWPVDADGSGVKKVLWAQGFSRETFFKKGEAYKVTLKGDKIVRDAPVRVPNTFRATGATMASIAGKETRALVFVDEYQRLRVSIGTEDTWRSSSPVGGGSFLKLELLKSGTTSRSALPCQTDTRGHGPWCREARRTASPSADSLPVALFIAPSASLRLSAQPNGRPAMIAPAAKASG